MTNTHDGSHTWIKYLDRLKKQCDEEIEEFIEDRAQSIRNPDQNSKNQ